MTMDFSKLTAYLDTLDAMQIFARDMMIQLEGKTVYRHFSGVHDAAGREPMDGREVYWMYSMTKPLTVACALKLMEEGKLGFTDPVSKYLPGWRVHPEATVEHLMSMKGGLDYELKAPEILACGPHADTLTISNALANRPLKFVPGTDFQYSLCLDVLAGVIEAASGMKFSEYMSKTLFEPLGMADSSLHLTENQKSRLCAQYQWVEAEKKSVPLGNDNIDYNLTDAYESGGAGLISTAEDYMRFVSAMARDGGGILKKETVDFWKGYVNTGKAAETFDQIGRVGYGYGLGVRVLVKKGFTLSPLGEFGWDGADGSWSLMDTDNHLAMVFTMHVRGCGPAYEKVHPTIRDLAYSALREAGAVKPLE